MEITSVKVRPRIPTRERQEQLLAFSVSWVEGREGSHGYAVGLTRDEADELNIALYYRYGGGMDARKWAWWRRNGDGTLDVEFRVPSGFTDRQYPWDWDGYTHLFWEWQERVRIEDAHRSEIRVGDTVWWDHDGGHYSGVVVGIHKRATVIVDHRKWRVPFAMLNKIG